MAFGNGRLVGQCSETEVVNSIKWNIVIPNFDFPDGRGGDQSKMGNVVDGNHGSDGIVVSINSGPDQVLPVNLFTYRFG